MFNKIYLRLDHWSIQALPKLHGIFLSLKKKVIFQIYPGPQRIILKTPLYSPIILNSCYYVGIFASYLLLFFTEIKCYRYRWNCKKKKKKKISSRDAHGGIEITHCDCFLRQGLGRRHALWRALGSDWLWRVRGLWVTFWVTLDSWPFRMD